MRLQLSTTGGGEELQKNTNSRRINNTLLNNEEVTKEIREIKRFLETNGNKITKPMEFSKSSSKMFIAIQSYLKKQEKHQTDNLNLHLKQLEKDEQKTPSQQEISHNYQSRNN